MDWRNWLTQDEERELRYWNERDMRLQTKDSYTDLCVCSDRLRATAMQRRDHNENL